MRLRYRGKNVPRCPVDCRTPEDREASGCDADACDTIYSSTCPVCLGASLECEACEGRGVRGWRRCPASIVTRDVWALLESYAAYEAHGVMPVAGGWMDQARVWTRWVRIVEIERAAIEEEKRPRSRTSPNAQV